MRLVLPFLALLALALAAPSPADAAESHTVRLRILEKGSPAAGIEVRVTYPSEASTIGTTIALRTDHRGVVTFRLLGETFWVTVSELNSKVIGRRFVVPAQAGETVQWVLRPSEWKRSQEVQP